VSFDADSGNAGVDVLEGSHEIQVAVSLVDDTTVNASAGTELDFNNTITTGGRTLSISGTGQVNINNSVVGGGSVTSSGVLGTAGSSSIGGNLTSTGTLDIDIAGATANMFDAFAVTGTATLSGMLSVDLVDGFNPSSGSFTVLTASSVSAASLTLGGPDASRFSLQKNPTSLILQLMGAGVAGDLNGDGLINFGDLSPFVKALTDPAGYATMFPGLDRVARCDTSGDGLCNFGDLTPFVGLLTGGPGSASAVPEPGSLGLVMFGLVAWISKRRCRG
jgi:hypothetical protein